MLNSQHPAGACIEHSVSLMLPAHFHDVTYDHIWSKIMHEITQIPTQKQMIATDE